MIIKSPHIDNAAQIAIASGNSIKEISEGWSKVQQVVHMNYHLTETVRDAILLQEPLLRYWLAAKTPHNAETEGFICNIYHVGISFPRS